MKGDRLSLYPMKGKAKSTNRSQDGQGNLRMSHATAESHEAESRSPERPSAWEERAANRLFLAFLPRLKRVDRQEPPASLAPFDRLAIPRSDASGELAATWYPATGTARGAVLLVHPWVPWGQSYFHRRGRIAALRDAGYHVLTFDLGGVGESGPLSSRFFDSDILR